MKTLLLLTLLTATAIAAEPPTVNVVVRVEQVTNVVATAPTNVPASIMPNSPAIITMSHQMRLAAQLARGKAAPWNQRLIVTAVEEKPLTRQEDEAPPVFSTNYIVTVLPVSDETNAPVTWGTARNKSIRFVTSQPVRKGDEFDLFPVKGITP